MTTQTQDREQADQDQTTSPDPTTPPTTKVRRPGFRKDEPQLSPPDPSPEPGADDSSDAGDGFPGPREQMPDEPSSRTGSSQTSSPADKKQLHEALEAGVAAGFSGVTEVAHDMLVHDPYAKHVGLFLADDQDVAAISEPGGNMIARRLGDTPVSGDAGDLIALLVAGAGYALKQLNKWRTARRLRVSGAAIDGFQPDVTPGEVVSDE